MKEVLCRISSRSGKNLVPEHPQQHVQVFPGILPAQGYPEGAVDDLAPKAHGGQNVAAVTLGAGASCGHADPGVLQKVDTVLGGNTGDSQMPSIPSSCK